MHDYKRVALAPREVLMCYATMFFFLPRSFSYKEAHSLLIQSGPQCLACQAGWDRSPAHDSGPTTPKRAGTATQVPADHWPQPASSRRDEPRTPFNAPRCGVLTPTDAAASARRLPPPPLPVWCLSPPKPSLALSSHMVHFFFNLRLGSAHLVCVDSILRHSTGTLNRGDESIEGLAAS